MASPSQQTVPLPIPEFDLDASYRHPADGKPMVPSAKLIVEVIEECARGIRKHGAPTASPARAIMLLSEELGEAARAMAKATSPNPEERNGSEPLLWLSNARQELVQLAAYALNQVQNIDNGKLQLNK